MHSQEVSTIALNGEFTIQQIFLDKKDLKYDTKPKELEVYLNNECAKHPSTTISKFFAINTLTFRYSYA